MPDQNTPNTQPNRKNKLGNMMGFLSQKGRFSTGSSTPTTEKPLVIPVTQPKRTATKPPITPVFSPIESVSAQTQEESASIKDPLSQFDGVESVSALAHDRLQSDGTVFDDKRTERELKITANAARSLTALFAGLSIKPGSGSEVPTAERKAIINDLIANSHQLTHRICQTIMGDPDQSAPDYLRAMVLTNVTKFISKQWEENKTTDIESLAQTIEFAISNQIPSFTQETLDLLDMAETYTPANTKGISEIKITNTTLAAQLRFLDDIELFHVEHYDPSTPKNATPSVKPFTYGHSEAKVTTDLLRCTLQIANENKLLTGIRDMDTMYMQNAITRAQKLVSAQYRKITDSMLKVAFDNELTSESAISYTNSLYDDVIVQIQQRARDNFIIIESLALDVMGIINNPHYTNKTENNISRGQRQEKQPAHQEQTFVKKEKSQPITPSPNKVSLIKTAPAVRDARAPISPPIINLNPHSVTAEQEGSLDEPETAPSANRSTPTFNFSRG